MARKLSDSAKRIRLLQTQLTNKQIADFLGYKGTSSVRKISNNRMNLSSEKLERAQELFIKQNVRRTSIPTPKEIHQKQKTLRSDWKVSNLSQFLDSIVVIDLFHLQDKLEKYSINYFYHSNHYDVFLLANSHIAVNRIKSRYVTNILFETSFNKYNETDKEIHVVQYPFYSWHTVVTSSEMDGFDSLLYGIIAYTNEVKESDSTDRTSEQYHYLNMKDDIQFLALVSVL